MNRLMFGLIMAVIFVFESSAQQHPREATEWIVSYSFNANKSDLPRVLLIGDSICNQYRDEVKTALAGRAYVTFFATSKCLNDTSYLRTLEFFLDEYAYDVIHFNNGLHSLGSDRVNWEKNLRAALHLIQRKVPKAKVIWAQSTPLKSPELTARAKELNAIAARVMAEEKIPVDDLFARMDPLERETYWSDTYHYKKEGVQILGKAVSDCCLAALGCTPASASEAKKALDAAATETGPAGKLK